MVNKKNNNLYSSHVPKRLKPADYHLVRPLVSDAECEKALIETVLSSQVKTEVYVDNLKNPNVVLLAYNNEAIIFGDTNKLKEPKKFFREIRKKRDKKSFSHIICPNIEWRDLLKELSRGRDKHQERVTYRFKGRDASNVLPMNVPEGFTLKKIDFITSSKIIRQANTSFIDFQIAWKTPEEFVESGLGYFIQNDNEIVSIAFSFFPVSNILEIGIATNKKYRRRKFASIVCARLIEDCLSQGIEPLFSNLTSNIASNQLAKSIGFEEVNKYYMVWEEESKLYKLIKRIRSLIMII